MMAPVVVVVWMVVMVHRVHRVEVEIVGHLDCRVVVHHQVVLEKRVRLDQVERVHQEHLAQVVKERVVHLVRMVIFLVVVVRVVLVGMVPRQEFGLLVEILHHYPVIFMVLVVVVMI